MTGSPTSEMTREELLDRKVELVSRMNEINSQLSELNNHIRSGGLLPNSEYRGLCNRKTQLCAEKQQTEAKLMRIKTEIQKSAMAEDNSKRQRSNGESAPIVRELVFLREKYQSFSADATRVSSMRRMASEFVIELNPIIKGAIRLAAKNHADHSAEEEGRNGK